LTLAIDEERRKSEERINDVVQKATLDHENQLKTALQEVKESYDEKIEAALKLERESSAAAIESACEAERKKSKELLEELKVSTHYDVGSILGFMKAANIDDLKLMINTSAIFICSLIGLCV
jgi:rubrerythrin